ncbi:MAG: hypothetical protein WDN28_31495 [Chthoniobacter sp.]
MAASFGLSPNQRAVAASLDSLPINHRTDALFDYLDYRKLDKLPGDFDRIAPEELTSIFTIGTSLATVQSQNIQRRTADIRSGTGGFSAAGSGRQRRWASYSGSFGPHHRRGRPGRQRWQGEQGRHALGGLRL